MSGLAQLVIGLVLMAETFFKNLFGTKSQTREVNVNWLQLVLPVILQIIQRLFEKKAAPVVAAAGEGAESPAFAEDHRFKEWEAKLTEGLKQAQAPRSNRAASGEDVARMSVESGLIGDFQSLLNAVKAKDVTAIKDALMSLLSKL